MSFDPISAGLDFAGKVVDRIWPDATEKQKAEASQRIADLAHEENIFGQEVADRASAREREAKISVAEAAPVINKVITPVLAIGVVVLSFILFYVVAFDTETINPKNKDIIIYILGALTTVLTQVIGYYFGSSSSSAQKSAVLDGMFKK